VRPKPTPPKQRTERLAAAKVGQLRRLLADLPDEANVYVPVEPDGAHVEVWLGKKVLAQIVLTGF
jgi:hypothetical protein